MAFLVIWSGREPQPDSRLSDLIQSTSGAITDQYNCDTGTAEHPHVKGLSVVVNVITRVDGNVRALFFFCSYTKANRAFPSLSVEKKAST
jgi:hypothetical protein